MRPQALIAEVTHRCPLHCVYCSNPLAMQPRVDEMPADVWMRVFREAADLGVLHVHLTGGEPVARPGLGKKRAGRRPSNLDAHVVVRGGPLRPYVSGDSVCQPRLSDGSSGDDVFRSDVNALQSRTNR